MLQIQKTQHSAELKSLQESLKGEGIYCNTHDRTAVLSTLRPNPRIQD